ncbi:MAG: NADH:flavin oxidoreductase/NADH oxidase, partial [Rhodospirillales bacterium]|nr:NADH:flavin oxidoreductase/NADH oxidase [Rhodospirillales bacterium]
PITLRGVTLANRVVVAPMCQYSAVNGSATDWHLMHLGQFSVSGTGLVIVEATGVEPEGRITPHCLGLWSDENEAALARVVKFCRDYGNTRMGIQLSHAGRKASVNAFWQGSKPVAAADGGWQTVAPSPLPFVDDGRPVPQELTAEGMARIKASFVEAAKRAARIGFDSLETHSAHGYLLHEFLSPISNQRTDDYGGSLENRMRYPLEVFAAIRDVWPEDKPFGVRVSATDWIDGGWDVESTLIYARELEKLGCDYLHVSGGGITATAKVPVGPGYQTGFAATLKAGLSIPVIAVGLITGAMQAENIIRSGQADMVALARGMLFDPRWTWHAANELGAEAAYPPQYERSHAMFKGMRIPKDPPNTR